MNFSQYALRKKQTAMVCFLFLFTLSFGWSVSAHPHFNTGEPEHVEHFDVSLSVNTDSSIAVKESIRYNFGPLERHGIYRDIPTRYETKLGARQSMHLSVESVRDQFGQNYSYTVSSENGKKRIKIGDPDRTVGGVHTYVITYTVRGTLGFFDDFDELYWNLTGNDWDVPIERVNLNFSLPQAVPWGEWRAACYYGPMGSTLSCGGRDSLGANRQPDELVQKISLDLERDFAPGEGVTVAFGFSKGVVREPRWYEDILLFIWENPFILLPFVVFSIMFTLWWKRGRDPKGRGVIIPEYETPEGLHPLEIAGIMEGKVVGKHIPAAIIDLAVKGYVKIEKQVEDRLLFDKTDYILYRSEKIPDANSLEEVLLEALFLRGLTREQEGVIKKISQKPWVKLFFKSVMEEVSRVSDSEEKTTVKLSDLKNKFYTSIPKLEKTVFHSLITRRIYLKSPKEVIGKFWLIGFLIIFCIMFFGSFLIHGGGDAIAIALAAATFFLFSNLMPRVTREGAQLKEKLLGLKEYLQIAEKNRLEFHNAPEKNPKLFEKLLPAAMILGVSEIWAKEFSDLLKEPPEWYNGPAGTAFSSAVFTADLDGFSSAAASTLSSSPGGSSGSGGGGFSGGGGGGGGGGSW